jgi:hypothetical protein
MIVTLCWQADQGEGDRRGGGAAQGDGPRRLLHHRWEGERG